MDDKRKSPLYFNNKDKANFIQEILDRCRSNMTAIQVTKLENLIDKLKSK